MAARHQQGQHTLDQRAQEIGARVLGDLAEARRAAGWSEGDLAKNAGVARKAIVQGEAGAGSVAMLIAVMSALRFQLAGIGRGDSLGEMIANRRVKRGLTVETAAEKAQLSARVVTHLEEGSGATSDLFRLLALIAPKVRRRAPERVYWSLDSKRDRDSRFTPPGFMDAVYRAFGPVALDPCAHAMSPVVATRRIMLAEGGDGLSDQWSGRLAFVNPPYSKQLDWLKRAYQQWSAGHVRTVLCLLPVRTDNSFFHETLYREADLFLLQGRLRFTSVRGDAQSTPFSLWVVTLGASAEQKAKFAALVRGCWFRAVVARRDGGQQAPAGGRARFGRFRLRYGVARRLLNGRVRVVG